MGKVVITVTDVNEEEANADIEFYPPLTPEQQDQLAEGNIDGVSVAQLAGLAASVALTETLGGEVTRLEGPRE